MAATFTPVGLGEMASFLRDQGFAPVYPERTRECVYGKVLSHPTRKLTLRVYTGIEPGTGESREKGMDAIRATVFEKLSDGSIEFVRGTKRVHRVESWRKNLQNRINELSEVAPNPLPDCPKCARRMKLREGKFGWFYGCSGYPSCRGIVNLPG